MDLGVKGQKTKLFANISPHRSSNLYVDRSRQPVVLADRRGFAEFGHSHSHVHIFPDQNHLTRDPDQISEIPHPSTNRTIFFRNIYRYSHLIPGR